MKRIGRFLREQPFYVDLALLALVAVHFWATQMGRIPNVWGGLAVSSQGPVQSLYLALLGPAAIVAGFAGVVVVFGLTATSARFQAFRASAGTSLTRTWVASTLAGFEAVVLLVAATVCSIASSAWLAPWLFELALLVMAHGAARLIWILSQLIRIVRADDIKSTDDANVYPVSDLPFRRNSRVG
ncbi:MAG: preprotein translocase subunit SecD [Microbacteriaceae bacterium]|nr:preprotein translocase subunit SecD [Microbacteriaceae bacterium]